jgi:hypothetical protein
MSRGRASCDPDEARSCPRAVHDLRARARSGRGEASPRPLGTSLPARPSKRL